MKLFPAMKTDVNRVFRIFILSILTFVLVLIFISNNPLRTAVYIYLSDVIVLLFIYKRRHHMKILIPSIQVPFVFGGGEIHIQNLKLALDDWQ